MDEVEEGGGRTSTDKAPADVTTANNQFTPSQRIAELNQIDTSISTLISSASTATSILSNQDSTPNSATTTTTNDLSAAKENFTAAASTYFSTLSSIEVRLRRQVYALEEAGLIRAGDERDARRGRNINAGVAGAGLDGSRRGGGSGMLDPSWLNARVSDGVSVGKRRELLAQAKDLIQRLGLDDKTVGQGRIGNGSEKEDVDADVDMTYDEDGDRGVFGDSDG